MSYNIKWEPNGLYWEYHGNISGIEVLKASMLAYGDSRFDTLNYKLVNFLDVENIEMSEDEVFVIAERHKAAANQNPYIKNAIVVGSKTKQLANKFASFFSDTRWDVRVFDDLNIANNWLDRKHPL